MPKADGKLATLWLGVEHPHRLIITIPPERGWWFDACGPSNLNGVYFPEGQHIGKLNGIKWHYFKGPSYSLRATTMMIRPLDFP
ncbi:hypothetical protein CRUP_028952 [Coryphaenoides rupestris]|nr:hypothetical protein CRUP_010004 [Coryphaenoides rupestris]KAG7253969.1 hypothetical protein CRUP_028952 [Coryphaenoides rupestris]